MATKKVKFDLRDNGAHDFQFASSDMSKLVCSRCGTEGIRIGDSNVIEVTKTSKNAELVEHCIPALKESETEMNLKYEFTETEIRTFGMSLAESYIHLHKLEDEKKSVVSEFKAKMDAEENVISDLSIKIKNGYEQRMVTCKTSYHTPRMNEKTIVRLDTGEEVAVLPMDDEDYNLFTEN